MSEEKNMSLLEAANKFVENVESADIDLAFLNDLKDFDPIKGIDLETVNLDETERAKAAISTAKHVESLNEKINALSNALQTERFERTRSDKINFWLVVATLIATIAGATFGLIGLLK